MNRSSVLKHASSSGFGIYDDLIVTTYIHKSITAMFFISFSGLTNVLLFYQQPERR